MKLTVEFLGLSRRLAQTKESLVELDDDQATLRDVLAIIASRFPALVGPVIDPQTNELTSAYMLNDGGRSVIRNIDAVARDGQRIIVMFVEAGG